MGYSRPYAIFCGAGEVLGALLLCSRRTATLGALILIAILSNVVMVNFAYDVAVKTLSVNLLLMACFVASRDGRWLAAVFLRGSRAPERPLLPELVNGARARAVLSAAGVVLACWLFIRPIPRVVENVGFHFTRRPPPAYGGVFDVEPSPPTGSTKVGAALPAWSNWRRVAVSARGAMVLNDADSLVGYALVADTIAHQFVLTPRYSSAAPRTVRYGFPDASHMVLRSTEADRGILLSLRRAEPTLTRWEHRWTW